MDLKARSCSSFFFKFFFLLMLLVWGFAFEGFPLADPCGLALTDVSGVGSTPVAIRSKTCHVQDVEQKSGKANCLLGCAMSAAE